MRLKSSFLKVWVEQSWFFYPFYLSHKNLSLNFHPIIEKYMYNSGKQWSMEYYSTLKKTIVSKTKNRAAGG